MTLKKLLNLKGRRALVTGATGHLGQVICDTLAELGADLILVDLPEARFKKLQTSLKKKWKTKTLTIPCNLELEDQRNKLIEQVKSSQGGLNILVNNAAFVGSRKMQGWAEPFEEQSLAAWRRALEVNLTAVFHLCQGLRPCLQKAIGANILNIGSIYGHLGPDWKLYEGTKLSNPAAYAASKGGLIQLTKWLATSLSPNIRVNAVSPGGIYRGQPVKFVKKYSLRVPLKRMASEIDIKGAITLCTTDQGKYMTAQNITIDGGLSHLI